MDYRTIYDHCHGSAELTEALCQKLGLPVSRRPDPTPEFKKHLGHFDRRNSLREITRLRQIAKTYQDLDELIDLCQNEPVPTYFVKSILDEMERQATDFYLKVNVLAMAKKFNLENEYLGIYHWLICHANLDQWITLYLHSPEKSYPRTLAFEQMVKILEEAAIKPQSESFYEEHLVSP